MTQVATLKRRPPLSEDVIAAYAKPPTKWKQLAIASNEQVFKTYRTRGTMFSLMAAASATGCIVSLSYSRTDLLQISGFFTVSSILAGLAFRYLGDTTQILKQRDDVRNNIETFTLANIRSTYRDKNVISDQELNEWARYFLHNQPFDKFLRIQWSSITDFDLEPDTIKLIKQKYFYRIYHPDNPKKLTHSNEVLKPELFTEEEQKAIKEFQKIVRGEFKISSIEDAQRKYLALSLPDIPSSQNHVYAWLFSIYIWSRGIGIEELKAKYVNELEKFTPYFTEYSPEQYIANRDAEVLNYDEFVKKNGEKAIHDISNFPLFLKLILQPNLGLRKTREKFQDDIDRFGAAAQIEQAVLEQEWSQLVHLTYTQVRDRNGQDAILEVSDPNVKKQLKAKFLRLPPRELANKDNYKEEIKVLEIEDREIVVKLSQTWGEMSFREILKLPEETRQLILEFSKKNGKSKAIEEIKNLPVAEILQEYQLLFQKGVLDLKDYDFTNRLGVLDNQQISPLLGRYGKFILENELLERDDFRLTHFIGAFIYDQRKDFLSAADLPKDGVWSVLSEFNLLKENWLACRKQTLEQLSEEKLVRNPRNVRLLESAHSENLKNISIEVQKQQEKSEIRSKEYKEKFVQAEKILKSKVKEQGEFLQACRDKEEKMEQIVKIHELEKMSLEEKQRDKEELGRILEKLFSLEKTHLGHLKSLGNLEGNLKEKNKTSSAVKILKSDMENITTESTVLNTRRIELVNEKVEVKLKLRNLENSFTSKSGDQLIRSSYITPIESAQTSDENSTEIEKLNTRLKTIESAIEDVAKQVNDNSEQIRNKKSAIEEALENYSQYDEYRTLRETIDKITEQHKALTAKKSELEKNCVGLVSLQDKVSDTVNNIRQFSEQKKTNMVTARRFEKEIKKLKEQKEEAESASNKADKELMHMRTAALDSRISEEKKIYDVKVEEERKRSLKAIKEIMTQAEAQLQEML